MADLIIKLATGDGNKLILQDKAGGAVFTTANSGATLANTTLTNPATTTDLTVAASTNAMVIGPVTIPNLTVNGNLNALQSLNVSTTLNMGASGSINVVG